MVDFNDGAQAAMDIGVFFMDVVLYVTIGLVFAGVLAFVIFMSKYDKRVVIRKKVNGKNKIFYDRARKIEKDGIIWWKLFKAKKKIEVPPNSAIEVDRRGKDFVELYELETGEFIPLVDLNDKLNSFEPFTTNQRQLLQGQYTKAVLERGFKLTDYIGAISYIAALVILVISLMVFYGDIAKPVLQMGDKQAAIAQKQLDFQKELNIMVLRLSEYQNTLNNINDVQNLEPRTNLTRGVPN